MHMKETPDVTRILRVTQPIASQCLRNSVAPASRTATTGRSPKTSLHALYKRRIANGEKFAFKIARAGFIEDLRSE